VSAGLGDGLTIREARAEDLEPIVRLHEDDTLGGLEDAWTPETRAVYAAAFAAIAANPDNTLYVAELDGQVVGTFQITVFPTLTGRGATRVRIGAVQVAAHLRSKGIGARMIACAEAEGRARGARSVELSSNKRRTDAHRFYERIGYHRSHEAFKKRL
jgi:GNAT superfamily N-acetyltransferase